MLHDMKYWKTAQQITIESSAELSGIPKEDKRAPGGYEIAIEKIRIIGLAETFPITKHQSEEFLRDYRHLWLRSRKMNSIMKIRGELLKSVGDFFRAEKFYEVSPPMFISSACEGGATLFDVKYLGKKKLFLTQSAQLHLEALIYSLEKVYCIAPSFRAEKSRTIRHLTEYWHIEAEMAFTDINDVMTIEEGLMSYICKKTIERCGKELKELGVDCSKIKSVKPPFPRITYTEAIERLNEKGINIKWGQDLGFNEEKTLADNVGQPFFIYAYPKQIKAFYCKTYEDNPELAMSKDLLVPKIGEISTGGAREDDKQKLLQRINELKLNEEDYKWYIDLRRYGTVPHTGFGLGVERLLTWMLDLENVIDTIPFPRTTRRFYP